MRKGQWSLKFTIRVTGETIVGDNVDVSDEVMIPLFANDALEAEQKARIAIADITQAIEDEDKEFFKKYCDIIEDEDGVSISDCRLCFEKAIDIPELCIVAGP